MGDEQTPLAVEPDSDAIKRRQGEYIVLSVLDHVEPVSRSGLKRLCIRVSGVVSHDLGYYPVYWPQCRHKRDINDLLHACTVDNWCTVTSDVYELTDGGREQLRAFETTQADRYEIDETLRATVEAVLSEIDGETDGQ